MGWKQFAGEWFGVRSDVATVDGTGKNEWNGKRGKALAMRNSKVFAGGTEAERRNSGLSPLPPLRGGERGKSLPGENLVEKPADGDRQQWLRENLPTVASVVDQFAAAFGRSNLKVAYASEGGHVLGKESVFEAGVTGNDQARAKPCDGCRHVSVKLVSPDGHRLQLACRLYRTAVQKCADFEVKR